MKQRLKSLLKKLGLYHPLQTYYRSGLSFAVNQYYRMSYARYRGSGMICNFCGAAYTRFVPEYPGPDIVKAIVGNSVIAGYGGQVYCPHCMSKNRERLLKDVIQHYLFNGDGLAAGHGLLAGNGVSACDRKVIHFSPERKLYEFLKVSSAVTTADIEPGFYKKIDPSIVYADATRLPFSDESFDVLIANHILEHIPEDGLAMKEMRRILKQGGVAILQVPYSETLPDTIEDRGIDNPVKQAALYGQRDHVRIYALHDYIGRLERAGFRVRVLTPEMLAPFRIHAIQETESVFLCYRGNLRV